MRGKAWPQRAGYVEEGLPRLLPTDIGSDTFGRLMLSVGREEAHAGEMPAHRFAVIDRKGLRLEKDRSAHVIYICLHLPQRGSGHTNRVALCPCPQFGRLS